jgi:hypothetical protein
VKSSCGFVQPESVQIGAASRVDFRREEFQTTRPQRKSQGYFWGHFSVDLAQIGARIIGFGRGRFGAEILGKWLVNDIGTWLTTERHMATILA